MCIPRWPETRRSRKRRPVLQPGLERAGQAGKPIWRVARGRLHVVENKAPRSAMGETCTRFPAVIAGATAGQFGKKMLMFYIGLK